MLLLLIAKLFPIAFPPIVIAAIIAATVIDVNNVLNLNWVTNIAAIVVPAAPDMIPHTSPITSQQKLETLSAFFLNLTAMFALLLFLNS